MAIKTLKPWPDDAVMICSANRGEELREFMAEVVLTNCRQCGRDLASCSRSIARAEKASFRKGRPIMFFCVECCAEHVLPPLRGWPKPLSADHG